jgi:hypothetical protein
MGHPLWRENGSVSYCTIASEPCQRVQVQQNSRPRFTVSFETPPTWRPRFPFLYPPGTGWHSYTPGHLVNRVRSNIITQAAIHWVVERCRCVGLTILQPSVSILSRHCGILNISQTYRPPRPVTGIALLYGDGVCFLWGTNWTIITATSSQYLAVNCEPIA